jgi:soluble lytic murein transglycosylase-like protein
LTPPYSRVGTLFCIVWLAVAGLALRSQGPTAATGGSTNLFGARLAEWAAADPSPLGTAWREARLRDAQDLHEARIAAFAKSYGIGRRLSTQIYEAAREERLNPALAYSLVRVESRFDPRVVGRAGAIGLTQIRLRTARELFPDVTAAELHSPHLNLRLGFRYLRSLLDRFGQDAPLALAAYNRGPTRVQGMLARGLDPRNAYTRKILRNVELRSAATL